MENKVRNFWSDRLAKSERRLVKLCTENSSITTTPPLVVPELLVKNAANYGEHLLLYKCVLDGRNLVERIKESLLQFTKFLESDFVTKWKMIQTISVLITETNLFLTNSSILYSERKSKKDSDTHYMPLAQVIGLVTIYRLLLNDVLLHQPKVLKFLDTAIDIVSTANTENNLLHMISNCRRTVITKQSIALKLNKFAVNDLVWVIKYGLRDSTRAEFEWLFGLISCLMIQRENNYAKLCRDLMVALDTRTIVSWGQYIITTNDFVKMFGLKTSDRNIQDKARNDFKKVDLTMLSIEIKQAEATQLYTIKNNLLNLMKTILLGSAKLDRTLPKWFNMKGLGCKEIDSKCHSLNTYLNLLNNLSKSVESLVNVVTIDKKNSSQAVKIMKLGLTSLNFDMIEIGLADFRRTSRIRSAADEIYRSLVTLRNFQNVDKSFLAGSLTVLECFINLFSGSLNEINFLNSFLMNLDKCEFVSDETVQKLVTSSLCERIAELNVAEAILCLDYNSHVPQTVIKINKAHQPFPILFCANMLQRSEFSSLYKSQIAQKTRLFDIYRMLNLKQPWFPINPKRSMDKIKHLISSCFVSINMMSFVDKKTSVTNKKFVNFEALTMEPDMKSIFTDYASTVIDKLQKSLDVVVKQLPRNTQGDQINFILDLLEKHETKLRKSLKYLETLGNCWAVQTCLDTYEPKNNMNNSIELQTAFMAILLVILKQASIEEQKMSMADIESKNPTVCSYVDNDSALLAIVLILKQQTVFDFNSIKKFLNTALQNDHSEVRSSSHVTAINKIQSIKRKKLMDAMQDTIFSISLFVDVKYKFS